MKTLYHVFMVIFTISLLLILVVFMEPGWGRLEKLLAIAFSLSAFLATILTREEWKRKERY